MVGVEKNSYDMLSGKLAQAWGWGGADPPISKHTARMVNGGVSIRLILYAHIMHGGFQKRLICHRLSSKLAHGSKQRRRWGGGLRGHSTRFCKHNARMVGFKKFICCQASLHKRGLVGAAPPSVQTYCSHGEWGFQKDSYYAWRISTTTQRLSSKRAHGFRQLGGCGGGQHPPFANNARMVGF